MINNGSYQDLQEHILYIVSKIFQNALSIHQSYFSENELTMSLFNSIVLCNTKKNMYIYIFEVKALFSFV